MIKMYIGRVELDTKVRPLADAFAAEPPLSELSLEQARARTAALAELIGKGPDLPSVVNVSIPAGEVEITSRLYEPAGSPLGVIVFFHGGGWVIGEVEHSDVLARQLAINCGCQVLSVEYRRAPEAPFPTPLDDCWAAFTYAVEKLADGRPVILAGDSAGGNLATACALLARERGGPRPALQVLMYPVTDADLETDSYEEQATGSLLTRADMAWFWDQYVPEASRRGDPRVSPLRAEDLTDLCPAIVIAPWFDPLRSEVEAYAERLSASGNQVALLRYPDQPHGFISLLQFLPTADLALREIGGLVRARLEGNEPVRASSVGL
jgi:acetyl esterase